MHLIGFWQVQKSTLFEAYYNLKSKRIIDFLSSNFYVKLKPTCVIKFRILLEFEAIHSIGDDMHSIFSNI